MTPDPRQAQILSSPCDRWLLLASRQSGKSQIAAALALCVALLEAPALILILSPSLRQSGELFRAKLLPLWRAIGSPQAARPPTQLTLELANGSRIISLPENEGGIRCFSGVKLLVIDEAARVSDSLAAAVRPMIAVSRGRMMALSTPFGKRGWFYEEWVSQRRWQRIRITAHQCPRITPQFLEEEKAAMGERWFRQEYECSFEDLAGAVFAQADIDAAMSHSIPPLFVG